MDVNYNSLTATVEELLRGSKYPLKTISQIECRLQYGCSKRATSEAVGVPILRMNNLQEDGWDLSNLKYVELEPNELANWKLVPGDIVFNRTNSKELVGKCEVFRESGTWVFASYLMRLQVDNDVADADFVAAFLNGPTGRAQIDRESRQIIGMSNINAEEIRSLRIPLPKPGTQKKLVTKLGAARSEFARKRAEASALLQDMDAQVLKVLGLVPPPFRDPGRPFAVRVELLRNHRIDPLAYAPFPIPQNPKKIPIKRLGDVAAINPNSVPRPSDSEASVPYVGLPECDINDVREVTVRSYSQVKGRAVAQVGDILFARIEPSVFNKKYVLVEHLAKYDHAYLSTEFYVVRARGDEQDQKYLYAMLQSSFVFNQVLGKTTGSSGRRRIDPEMFASLRIPWPDRDTRKEIARDLMRRRNDARTLRQEARAILVKAARQFDEALLGPRPVALAPGADE